MMTVLLLMALAYAQNITFSIVSRARNRDNMTYHALAAVGSNFVWFCTFRLLVVEDMSWALLIPYTIGTVAGSLTGAWVSIRIEKMLGAKA